MPVKNKNKVNQLISHLSSCLYIISGIVLLSTGRTALAIDYIEITNPKFIPVKVGVVIGAGTEADEVLKIFKENLDKVLYFEIIPGTKKEFEKSNNIIFHVELKLEKEGYEPFFLVSSNPSLRFQNMPLEVGWSIEPIKLLVVGSVPKGMVYIPGGPFIPAITGQGVNEVYLHPFYIDKNEITNKDKTVRGFNLGTNIGKVSGQSINHCHIHLIPRRSGDVENPQGGVRSVIASKQHYVRKTK